MMVLACRGIVIACLLAGMMSAARAAPDPDDPAFRARLADIAGFVRLVTGYDYRGPIDVVVRTPEQLNRMHYGENYAGQDRACAADPRALCVKASALGGTIFLGSDFVLGADDYVLAHEIAHVMQFQAGVADEAACMAAMEPEAYAVQEAFVAATGRGVRPDRFTVMVLSMCDPGR